MSVKVSPKFQVVIPEEVRQVLNITPGSRMEVLTKGGVAYLVPVMSMSGLKKSLKGKFDSQKLRDKKDRQR